MVDRSTTLVVAAIPLPIEELRQLAAQNLLLAHTETETPEEIFELIMSADPEHGFGLLSTFTDPSVKSAEDVACRMLDSFGPAILETSVEEPAVVTTDSMQQQPMVTRIEVYGVRGGPQLSQRLAGWKFSEVFETANGCAAIRKP